MGLLIKPQAATYNDTEGWFYNWLTDSDSEGAKVNPSNAMRISTVWKCVRARGETFGMLPKKMFERVQVMGRASRKEAPKHPLFDLVHTAPNPQMTSMAFFELVSADLDLWGNSYSYVERFTGSTRIRFLWRIRPDLVRIYQNEDGSLWYLVRDGNGVEQTFYPDEILHIRGLGFDGICGYSPIQMQKKALEWNKNSTSQNSDFYKNASRPSFIASVPAAIKDPKAKEALIKTLTKSGSDAGKGLLVEGPIDVKMLSVNPEDAEFIETIQYQEEDICGIFRVPPHKVGILRRATNNNIEHQDIEWVRDSIQPICERVEQWFDLQLLSDRQSSGFGGGTERERFFMECELKGLLRGDTAAQTSHIREMIDKGVYSPNDGRDYLGQPPYEGGDVYLVNGTYIPIELAGQAQKAQIEAAKNPPEPARPDTKVDADNLATLLTQRQAMLDAESQVRVQKAYRHVFRDACGRVIARKPADREKTVPTVFQWLLTGLADGFEIEADSAFIGDYLGSMGKRAKEWSDADVVAKEELSRAVTAIMERASA